MCQTRQKSVTNSPNLHNDPVARPGSYGASRPDNALTCLPWAVVSAAQRLDSRRPCGSAVPGGLQQQKSTFQVCADNRHQTTDMTCGCRRAVAHIARCMTANGRSLDGAVKPHPRGVDQTTGLPWGFIGEFSPSGAVGLGRWLSNDIADSSQHVSRWRLPVFGAGGRSRWGQAAVAAMAAAGSFSQGPCSGPCPGPSQGL